MALNRLRTKHLLTGTSGNQCALWSLNCIVFSRSGPRSQSINVKSLGQLHINSDFSKNIRIRKFYLYLKALIIFFPQKVVCVRAFAIWYWKVARRYHKAGTGKPVYTLTTGIPKQSEIPSKSHASDLIDLPFKLTLQHQHGRYRFSAGKELLSRRKTWMPSPQ